VRYGSEIIDYRVEHSARRKTLSIEVHPDAAIVVRAPVDCSPAVIERAVRRRAKWITRQRTRFARYKPRTPPRRYVSGETHLYLGRQYRLKVVAADQAAVKLSRDMLLVETPHGRAPEHVGAVLRAWYRERARQVFGQVIEERFQDFARRGQDAPRLAVRAMKTRWGSLAASGLVTLNVELIRAPRPCIEYVVTHELCHLVHKHHGLAFYRMLNHLMADWPARRAKLELALL